MQAKPISEDEFNQLSAKAWFDNSYGSHAWRLSETDIMGILECGESKAARYRAIVITRLSKAYPHGRPKDVEGLGNGSQSD